MHNTTRNLGILIAVMLLLPARIGQSGSETPLKVGLHHTPPFVIETPDGRWEGLAVELWQAVARKLEHPFTFHKQPRHGLLTAVQDAKIDLAIGDFTMTSDQERVLDFSHAFYTSGLGIAVPHLDQAGWRGDLRRLFSWPVLRIILAMLAGLLVAGLLVWLFERRRNAASVGYGDKAPVTFAGRFLALIWMFLSLFLVASFTAAITSNMTVDSLQSRIKGPGDLEQVRVATLEASPGAAYLRDHGLGYLAFETMQAALEALAAGRVDAVVAEKPQMQHLVKVRFAHQVRLLPHHFQWAYHAFALPPGTPLREPINQHMLAVLDSDAWVKQVRRYMGRD